MKAWVVLVVLGLGASPAHADRWRRAMDRWQGGAWLHYEVTGLTSVLKEPNCSCTGKDLVLAGARLHGFLGANASIAYHIGVDLMFGSTLREAGFAYDVAVFPVGVVARAGKTSFFGLGVGVGGVGAIGTMDDALTLPVEMTSEIGIGRRLRILSRARVTYNAFAHNRHDAAPSIAFADELDAMLGLRVGRYYDDYGFPSGNGYFVGVSYRELAQGYLVGLTIGYSIDLAMPRRWVDERDAEYDNRGRRRRRRSLSQ